MDEMVMWLSKHNSNWEKITISIIFFTTALILILYANRVIKRILLRIKPLLTLSYDTAILILRLSNIILWIVVGMLLLNIWGISVHGLWTVFVGVGTIIGVGFLAVWTMISNVTASVFLSWWHPFFLGSTVEILPEGQGGRVIDRNMMFTILREKEGATLHVPNNIFFQKMFRVIQDKQMYLLEDMEHIRKRTSDL